MKKNIYIIIFLHILSTNLFAQRSIKGTPISLQNKSILTNDYKKSYNYVLPFIDNDVEIRKSKALNKTGTFNTRKIFYGKGNNVSIDIKKYGQCFKLNDGTNMWLLKIESETAFGMQFFFNKFNLPENAKLYIFNEDGSNVLGAYTKDNNPKNKNKAIKFGTQYLNGKNIYIEYTEPENPKFPGEISINNIVHLFYNFQTRTGPYSIWNQYPGWDYECMINISCPQGANWSEEARSVVLILCYDDDYDYMALGSGALINNTRNNGNPYLLTARHLYEGSGTAYDETTWIFLFNHQTEICEDDGSSVSSSLGESVYGSVELSADQPIINWGDPPVVSDYLLLEINSYAEELEQLGVCFSGWTIEESVAGPYTGIHHPMGDVKKISIENDDISTNNTYPNLWLIGSISDNTIGWDEGVTAPGSSGSPLYDANHRIIGQLFGGESMCDSTEIGIAGPDWYGKFSVSYEDGDFAFWLDPDYEYPTYVDTYCPIDSTAGDTTNSGTGTSTIYCISDFDEGIILNGDQNFSQVVNCISMPIIMVAPECDSIDGYGCYNLNPYADWFTKRNIPDFLNWDKCYFELITPWRRYCLWFEIFVEITKVDNNLNPIEEPHSAWIGVQHITYPGIHPDYPYFIHFIGMMLNEEDLMNKLNLQLENGLYKIKMAKSRGGWSEGSRYFRYSPETDITLSNITVQDNISYMVKGSITIQPNSQLLAGSFIVDENCGTTQENLVINNNTDIINYNQLGQDVNYPDYIEGRFVISDCGCKEKNTDIQSVDEKEISIIPNPFSTAFQIVISEKIMVLKISIIDLTGKIVKSIYVNKNGKYTVNTNELSSGTYFVRIITKNRTVLKKIIKN